MTVDELIERLKNYHGSTPVLVDGYEGDYDDMTFSLRKVVMKAEGASWWIGEYEEDEDSGVETLILGRKAHD